MKIGNFLFTLFAVILISGCSARSKGFFEDLYSQTEVRPATKQDYATITGSNNAPIVHEDPEEKKEIREVTKKGYSSDSSEIYTATGEIIDADYDKDVNLYIYAFLKSGTAVPISFYSDKDLRPIGGTVTVSIKDNFLIDMDKKNSRTKSSRSVRKNWKKRKKSSIQTPYEEKINTL